MAASAGESAYPPELPAFLRQSKAERHNKYIDLEWAQRNRLLAGSQTPASADASTTPATASPPASQWRRITNDPAVAERNRYMNVEPYAANRVKLNVAEGVCDYINASPITLGKRRYIATQGPKNTSVSHFYRMLQEQTGEKAVVVMLTQTHEAGREKCFQYYPLVAEESPMVLQPDTAEVEDAEGKKPAPLGEVELLDVQQDQKTRSEIRRLRLHLNDEDGGGGSKEKEIHHLLFSGWPDFLIPEGDDREAMIELIRLSARLNSPNPSSQTNGTSSSSSSSHDLAVLDQSNPRIIHCSAGVGRSGTFIALDYLLSLLHSGALDHLPSADSDPVAETVDRMRQQRMMMVQGEPQFNFIYDVLREQFLARLAGGGDGGRADAVGGADG
ncbi:receptor/non-receptor type protein-tyrosine phosphatase [Hortaea werneckii]|uniref:Tyrosine specific protein phosphatases domain-containing protein n=1 Tax=Hortaea werneckii TaxID=91943 RepID=A0A3M7GZC5_HORWE|nr:receptor/non-receptor type protein-tyrosine phosphatase [Hortaea werneckii]KAI7572454.1 receptor/non-receptor type protein-tyrosine phosphatase [Hortaea werneckii]KAI7627591.1 receptor/non-receptor type protein-tyrosine phosphatase [Hortaea werneckii]KAI7637444.1 receptor/non-receptor type protein-tyrosine phosphatase [Hortaea werneckii]KAI7683161.1 receptor/non-receptor type protein-tyrosine phosphatase [Hortaea werneckii]